jgi:hypothetical protein
VCFLFVRLSVSMGTDAHAHVVVRVRMRIIGIAVVGGRVPAILFYAEHERVLYIAYLQCSSPRLAAVNISRVAMLVDVECSSELRVCSVQ